MPSSSRSSPPPRPTSSRRSPASATAPDAPEAGDRPLDPASFARLIEALGPFERQPRLAVAVSGGPDSMALCLLADRWARARGGGVTALTVDHRLRPESTGEARQVGVWVAARGIAHEILVWHGAKPTSGIQAAARGARYDLLTAWCRQAGVLHLLLAHHRDDQAETVALRRARGSGPDGLAGMAAVREVPGLRVLRPLLDTPKSRLIATLAAEGQPWIDDPSNRDPGFARSRLRLAGGQEGAELAHLAACCGHRRAALDACVALWLVDAARIDPAGFLVLSRARLQQAAAETARRALEQALAVIGARRYAPRAERLADLLASVRAGGLFRARTLAGCRIIARDDRVLICREPASIADFLPLRPGRRVRWDDRFDVAYDGPEPALVLRALGQDRLSQRRRLHPMRGARDLPAPVRPSLPSLWSGDRLLFAPHLGLVEPAFASHVDVTIGFRPRRALAGARFACSWSKPEPEARFARAD